MFINYLKIALRNIARNKIISFINISGLTIGLVCFFMIALYVYDELTYDRFFKDSDRIYRIVHENIEEGGAATLLTTPGPLAPVLNKDFPQVEKAVRIWQNLDLVVKNSNQIQYYAQDKHIYADPGLFNVFHIPFLFGNPETALKSPNGVIITDKIARLFFKTENVVGKVLVINKEDYEVTGVIRSLSHHTHLPQFEFITSIEPVEERYHFNSWLQGVGVYTYVKLAMNVNVETFQSRILDIADQYVEDELDNRGMTQKYFLQPITDIHLHPNYVKESGIHSKTAGLVLFSAIAFLVLFIASINFINSSLSLAFFRIKEISIRKTNGANRTQLVSQFVTESIVISVIAVCLALVFIYLLTPWFNEIIGKELNHSTLPVSSVLFFMSGVVLCVGFFTGIFPALLIFSFRPAQAIKGIPLTNININNQGIQRLSLRKILVIVQFVITSVFIVALLVIFQQINYMKNKDLGFEKEQILVFPVQTVEMCRSVKDNLDRVKQEFTRHHTVQSITTHLRSPGRMTHQNDVFVYRDGEKRKYWINMQFLDSDFLQTYKIPILAGADFTKNNMTQYILNEAASREFGFHTPDQAIGNHMSIFDWDGEIVGVTKNFHFWSLHYSIEPMVFIRTDHFFPEAVSLKLNTKDLRETMTFIENTFKALFPDQPFEYYFLDEDFNRLYKADVRFAFIILLFTGTAIFIACLGLFGLSLLTIQRKIKEIGIRKVLGSSIPGIIYMLIKEYSLWMITASVISWPIAWYVMRKWLLNFAYRIDIELWMFVLAGAMTLVIALLTVTWQAVRAATANPVEALRYE
ncbi:ABC transporter permease [candidate division KSB1 bacterium]|nr:ABC transporter permease [candidate division KSB1 bacterium]